MDRNRLPVAAAAASLVLSAGSLAVLVLSIGFTRSVLPPLGALALALIGTGLAIGQRKRRVAVACTCAVVVAAAAIVLNAPAHYAFG